MRERLEDFRKASVTALKGHQILVTAFIAVLGYSLMTLASFPSYSSQLIGRSIFFLPEAIRTSSLYVMDSSGILGLALTGVYAVLIGISVSVLYIQFRMQKFSGVFDMFAFVPGVLVSGCAGCGVGLISAAGLGSVLALLPFNGNLVRVAGIILMVYLLSRTGDPRQCEI